jgi:hypothetical protein
MLRRQLFCFLMGAVVVSGTLLLLVLDTDDPHESSLSLELMAAFAGFLVLASLVGGVDIWLFRRQRKKYHKGFGMGEGVFEESKFITLYPILVTLALGLVFVVVIFGADVYQDLAQRLHNRPFQLLVIFAVMFSGWILHRFKQWNQYLYGVTETAFGVASIIRVASGIGQQALLTQWTIIVGCVYIIARGLNNCHEAKSKNIGVRILFETPTGRKSTRENGPQTAIVSDDLVLNKPRQ